MADTRLAVRQAARVPGDFREMFRYGVEHWGPEIALAYLASFDSTLALIARHPRIGRPRPRLAAALRSIKHRSHILFYRVHRDHILIVRVLHSAMDSRRHV